MYFEVQRHKTHLFVDLKDTQTIAEFKKVIEHILNVGAFLFFEFLEQISSSSFI